MIHVCPLVLFVAQDAHPERWAALASQTTTSAATSSFTVTNLGVSVLSTVPHERWLAVPRLEFEDGQDLNGDGDTMDQVLFVYDRLEGTFTNLLFAVQGAPRFRGPLLPFGAYELPMQTDLNGDGDMLDEIVHLYDARDGSIRSTLVAAQQAFNGIEDFVELLGRTLVYVAGEEEERRDLNGDGDALDNVVRVVPLARGARRPGAAVGSPSAIGQPGMEAVVAFPFDVAGTTVILRVDEADSGLLDLNGDGDAADRVLQGIDSATLVQTNYGIAGEVIQTFGERAAVYRSEFEEGLDLNGDGDFVDGVVHVLDTRDGSLVSSGKAGILAAGLLDETLCMLVYEKSEGDLNGDGDVDDYVAHILDLKTQALTNTMLASRRPKGDRIDGSHTRFLLRVRERSQGNTDLNGDGDTGDYVLHAVSTSGAVLNVATAVELGPCSDRLVTIAVDEQDQRADFNFDGDTSDLVLGVYDGQLDLFRNLAIATASPVVAEAVDGPLVLFPVGEGAEGSTDLNGDGDILDEVLHVYDAETNVITNLGLAVPTLFFFRRRADMASGLVTVPVSEAAQGMVDLNGDGDTLDSVLHLVELR